MKAFTILFLIFCANSAFSQLSTSPSKSVHNQALKSDSIHFYIDNKLITNQGIVSIDNSPVYMKYVAPVKTNDSIAFMLDSTLVDQNYIHYLDPYEINDINIFKNTRYPKGVIYMKLKDHALLSRMLNSKLLSFSDIRNKYMASDDTHKPVIYLLDKELITDTTKKRIPEMCLAHVTVAKVSEMPYFKTAMPDVLIMMITTKPASTKPYHTPIIIRGAASN